ncbi:TolC family protein [Maribellus maritimus]|uniref:TolC family protein n=1 Tax=Maribellus maritimus TaxID=2870838 RepID=UPI001EEA71F9|nr:TolC family protein [Maribellus maritimus]MCG6189776.1 TolC family protein [Maribellus maritimus]
MTKTLYLILILSLFQGKFIHAQEKWTLERCIEYAVANNLDVRDRELQSEMNEEYFKQSKRNLLPYVSLSGGGSNSFGKSLDYDTYEYTNTSRIYSSFNLSTGVDIFRGFIRQNTISLRKMNHLAGIEDEKMQKYNIAFSVMEAYYNTVYFKGLMEIVAEQIELSRLNVEQAKRHIALGLKAKSDLLEMESALAKEEVVYIQTENSYKGALLDLKQTMNITPDEDFDIEYTSTGDELSGVDSTTPSAIFNKALDFYPTVKAGELRKEAAQKELAIAKGYLWPSLSLSGGYSSYFSKIKGNTNTETFSNQIKNNASQSISLSLSVPIFEKLAYRSDIKRAQLNYLQAETQAEKTSQQLFNEITQNYQDLESYNAEYTQLEKQVDFAQIAYEVSEKKMEQGLISVIELYSSKNTLAQAKSDLLRTKLQYTIKKKTIDFYLGEPLPGISLINLN